MIVIFQLKFIKKLYGTIRITFFSIVIKVVDFTPLKVDFQVGKVKANNKKLLVEKCNILCPGEILSFKKSCRSSAARLHYVGYFQL